MKIDESLNPSTKYSIHFLKRAVNACFWTGSFSKKMVVFEADIFVGQSEDEVEVRCEVSRRVKIAVSRYSGPSGLRLRCGGCYSYQFLTLICSPGLCSQLDVLRRGLEGTSRKAASTYTRWEHNGQPQASMDDNRRKAFMYSTNFRISKKYNLFRNRPVIYNLYEIKHLWDKA